LAVYKRVAIFGSRVWFSGMANLTASFKFTKHKFIQLLMATFKDLHI